MKYWIGVVSREHVKNGEAGGFAQVCHGKQAPLKRMKAGDWMVYYSPKEKFNEKTPCQMFTAIGYVKTGEVYQFDMGNGFKPYRIDIEYVESNEVAIKPLIRNLSFIKNKARWGFQFRYGHIQVPERDFELIASSMHVDLSEYNQISSMRENAQSAMSVPDMFYNASSKKTYKKKQKAPESEESTTQSYRR